MTIRKLDRIVQTLTALLMAVVVNGCSLIDDDLSGCDTDQSIDYELELVTNMNIEINTQLSTIAELGVAAALRSHLTKIFTDFAHDASLSFYDKTGDSLRAYHETHIMDANQARYTFTLPRREYMHLAVANVMDNRQVTLTDDDRCHGARLSELSVSSGTATATTPSDTLASHTTGLFTARQPMDVVEGQSHTYHVRLYMANSAAALVVDPRGLDASNMQVFTTGFASAFSICDSTYRFNAVPSIVRATAVNTTGVDQRCFCSVNFPSHDTQGPTATRTIIETTEPFVSLSADQSLWQFRAYVRQANGTITETVLGIHKPLRAGQLMIIKAYLTDDGALHTDDQTVGVSVTLDWQEAGHHDVEL